MFRDTLSSGVARFVTHAYFRLVRRLLSHEAMPDPYSNVPLDTGNECEVSRLLCGRGANLTTEFITGYVAVISTLSYLMILDVFCLSCNKG